MRRSTHSIRLISRFHLSILLTVATVTALQSGCGGHGGAAGPDAGSGIDGNNSDGGGSGHVDITLINRPNAAATFDFLVAYQDGDGPWQLAPAPTGDVYSLPISSGRYAVAWTCVTNTGGTGGVTGLRQTDLFYSTVAEHPSLTRAIAARCTDRITTVTLSGVVSNLTASGRTLASYSDLSAVVSPTIGNYTLATPTGTRDLLVMHTPILVGGGGVTDVAIDEAIVQRGLAVTANATANVDFTTAAATQTFPVTVALTGNQRATVSTTLYTAGGTIAELVHDTAAPFETTSLAAAEMRGSDVYDQSITVAALGQLATVSNATATPAAQTYVAPSPLGGATATVPTTTPYPEVKTTWAAYTNAIGYDWTVSQSLNGTACGAGVPTCTVAWTADLTAGWIGSAPSYQMPDLSKLTGWNASLQLVTGTQAAGSVAAVTSSAGAGDFPLGIPTAGTKRTLVASDYTVTP